MPQSLTFVIVASAAAVLCPSPVRAHGAEYLYAKLSLRPGDCTLEVTADYGANPMLHDEAEARAAITGVLRLGSAQAKSTNFTGLGAPRFEKRFNLDKSMPGYDPLMDQGGDHRLLTGVWRWKPQSATLQFEVPRESPHDVLLWTAPAGHSAVDCQWVMLIAGYHSPLIATPSPKAPRHWDSRGFSRIARGIALLALVGAVLGVARHRLWKNNARPA